MTKWRSKATGTTFDAYDTFNIHSSESEYRVALFLEGESWEKERPRARMKYAELIESFEKVEQ
jgi:hypothetical protein